MPTQRQKDAGTAGLLAFLAFVVIIVIQDDKGKGGPDESPTTSRPPAISHITATPKR